MCEKCVCVSQLLQATIVCKRKFPIEMLPSIDIKGEHIIIDYIWLTENVKKKSESLTDWATDNLKSRDSAS